MLAASVTLIGAYSANAQTLYQSTTTNSTNNVVYPNANTNATGTGTVNGVNSTGSATPGVPNTGAGGDTPLNAALLIGSGLVAVMGLTYLGRTYVRG